MATITTTSFPIPVSAERALTHHVRPKRRRITPRAGQALEKLGHAIEYLTDEFLYVATPFSANNPQLEAVQLLMALNRQVYFECPVTPASGERWRTFLRSHLPWLRPRDAFKVAEIPRRFHAGHSLEGMPL